MKKLLIVLLGVTVFFASTMLAAQTAVTEYTVKTVTGKVEYEVSAGKWAPVTVKMKLLPSTVINTTINSTLVVELNGKLVTIKPMKKGTLEVLIADASGTGGVKIGSGAKDSNITASSGKSTSNIATASTRASEATTDLEWVDDGTE